MPKPTKVLDFLTYGDQNGLTKLEVLYVLEQVVLDAGLYDTAKAKLDEAIEESNSHVICEECGVQTKEVEESKLDGSLLSLSCLGAES